MSVIKITKIKVDEFNLVKELTNKKNSKLQKCRDLLSDLSLQKVQELLPQKSKYTVSFELSQTNASLANGIRRCLRDEIETLSFDFDENKDVDSNDPFILSDFVKKQVDLLPINQDLDYSKYEITLNKENNTDEIIDVTSDDFIILDNKKKKDTRSIVGGNIVICRLRPNSHLIINNIFVSKGIAIKNAAKYNLLSNVTYKILDVDPLIETKIGHTGTSSMRSEPKTFFISYTTHRNIDKPRSVMIKCCDTLINRLKLILTEMKKISNKDVIYTSDLITLESVGDLHKIYIHGEYWTIINMITWYCYTSTKRNIKSVIPSLLHPEKEVGIVSIIHPEFSSVIQKSITNIIADLEIVKSQFN